MTACRHHPSNQLPMQHSGNDQGHVRGTVDTPSQGNGHPQVAENGSLEGRDRTHKVKRVLQSSSAELARRFIRRTTIPTLSESAGISLQAITASEKSDAKVVSPSLVHIGKGYSPMGGRLPNGEIAGANGKTWIVVT